MLDYFSGWPNFPTDTGPYNNLATVSNYLLGGLPIGASSSGGSGSVDYTQEQKEADCEEGLRQDNQNSNTVENVLAKYDTILGAAGNDNGLAALVASIGIIESGFQDLDENDGKGVGVGVYQITVSATSGVTAAQANDFTWATNYAVNKLVSNGANLAGAFPNFTPAQLLQATAASWNLGVGGISGNPDTIDDASNGPNHQQDYGSVVLLLMNCFD
jgi:hypothetical protein